MTRSNLSTIRQFFHYLQDALPAKLHSIHILNVVSFFNKILYLVKPFMKAEIYNMVGHSITDTTTKCNKKNLISNYSYTYIHLQWTGKNFTKQFQNHHCHQVWRAHCIDSNELLCFNFPQFLCFKTMEVIYRASKSYTNLT
jgi:hypothetical protein